MNYITNNKYIFFIILLTFIARIIYHTNAPFFEDEGLFLLDSSKDFTNLYVNTLYMKPFFGAYYYHLIYKFFAENSFLALHISTTIFIIISNVLLYKIVKFYTQNDLISIIAPLSFLTFSNLSVGGHGHSSLEHFQLVFLLGAYYFIFIKSMQKRIGLILLTFAIMVKQNAFLTVFVLFKDILKEWKLALLITFLWIFITFNFFDNFIFNNFVFPLLFYNANITLSTKLYCFYNYFLKVGYGFPSLILSGAILSFILFYKNYKKEFLFILSLALSMVSTPLFPQHFIAIFPFLIIVFNIGFNKLYIKYYPKLYAAVLGGVILLLIFNFLKLYKNYKFTSDLNSLTMTQTVNGRLDGNKDGINELLKFFETIKNQKVYIYPILFPHPYITYNFSTIDKFYSNDHIDIILKHSFLRDKLLDSIKSSKPTYLVKMKNSEMDKYMNDILNNYLLIQEFGNIKIYKIKEQ
jgi:hypothetical protein